MVVIDKVSILGKEKRLRKILRKNDVECIILLDGFKILFWLREEVILIY